MERIFLILIFLGCMLLPFSASIAHIAMMVFAGGIVLESIFKKEFPQKKDWLQLGVLPSFFFLLALLGTGLSSYPSEGFHLVKKFISFMVFSLAYLFANDKIKKETPAYVSSGLVIGVTTSLIYLFIKLIIGFIQSDEESIVHLFSHRFTYFNFTEALKLHPTYLSIWILLANYFVYNSKKIGIKLKTALLFLFFMGMVFTMSRVGLFIYGLQILGLFFFLSARWKKIYALGMGILLAVGIYLYNFQLHNIYLLQRFSIELSWDTDAENTGTEINNRVADDSRTARWSAIWQTIQEKPILGYGTGSEKAVLAKTYEEHDLKVSLERMYNTHNQYLFYMLEQGLLGLVLFLSFFAVNMVSAVKRRDLLSISFIIGILLVCIFENYMYRTMGYLTMALFLSFMRTSKK